MFKVEKQDMRYACEIRKCDVVCEKCELAWCSILCVHSITHIPSRRSCTYLINLEP